MNDLANADVKHVTLSAGNDAANTIDGAGEGVAGGVIDGIPVVSLGNNPVVPPEGNLDIPPGGNPAIPQAQVIHGLSLGVNTPPGMNIPLSDTIRASDTGEMFTSGYVMETFYAPIYILTGVFGAIFVIGPFFVGKGEHQGIIRTCIMLTSFCMWIFWVTVYIAQMNPLVGPCLSNATLAWIAYSWGNLAKELPPGFDDVSDE